MNRLIGALVILLVLTLAILVVQAFVPLYHVPGRIVMLLDVREWGKTQWSAFNAFFLLLLLAVRFQHKSPQ